MAGGVRQLRLHQRHQLTHGDRFGAVRIGAGLHASLRIASHRHGRERDHPNRADAWIGVGAYGSQHREAVELRHLNIEHQHSGGRRPHGVQRRVTVSDARDAQALRREIIHNEARGDRIVLRQQDGRLRRIHVTSGSGAIDRIHGVRAGAGDTRKLYGRIVHRNRAECPRVGHCGPAERSRALASPDRLRDTILCLRIDRGAGGQAEASGGKPLGDLATDPLSRRQIALMLQRLPDRARLNA
jgi:hypothetical protein